MGGLERPRVRLESRPIIFGLFERARTFFFFSKLLNTAACVSLICFCKREHYLGWMI